MKKKKKKIEANLSYFILSRMASKKKTYEMLRNQLNNISCYQAVALRLPVVW